MDRRLLAALVLPFALTACGSDGDDDRGEREQEPEGRAALEPGGDLSEQDAAAIQDTVLDFLLTGDCDLTTDEYLNAIAFFADDDATREESCELWRENFVEPQYDEDDILLSDLTGEDGVATLQVGSNLTTITTLYRLTLVDDTWLMSGDEYNTDGL